MDDVGDIGRRLREIRSWRELSMRAAAELSGITHGYLGQIERGEKPVNNRNVLESLASALRVAPSELTGRPWAPTDPIDSQSAEGLRRVEVAVETLDLGHDPGVEARPWDELRHDVDRINAMRHLYSDYTGQAALAPSLLTELHAAYVRDGKHQRDVLLALILVYASAAIVCKRWGSLGFGAMAARGAQQCAAELDRPEWRGYATWLRSDTTGELSRSDQYNRCVRTAEDIAPELDEPSVAQAVGMLHLSAAMASAAQDDRETTSTHLAEADGIAARLDFEVGSFARLWFGPVNIGIWKTSLAAEFGDIGQVLELADSVHADAIPSPTRQAQFSAEVGRVLIGQRTTRERGMAALLEAEKLAPQRIRNDVFVREAISDRLRAARREAGGRELRGLAYRVGVAPTGSS